MNKKHIVCYGDSNTWGYHAAIGARYDDDERWTIRLGQLLGEEYMVLEEGTSGRTTVHEDPNNEGLCGLAHLPTALSTHSPVDLLILMLGTNDCKQRFAVTPQDIADSLKRLIRTAQHYDCWRDRPRILVVAPIIIAPYVHEIPYVKDIMGEGCVEKSRALPALFRQTAEAMGCWFEDCNESVHPGYDGMHFDPGSNQPFAEQMARAVRRIFAEEA